MIDLDRFAKEELPEIKQAIQVAAWDNDEHLDLEEDIIPLVQAFEAAYKAWKDEQARIKEYEFRWMKMREAILQLEKDKKDLFLQLDKFFESTQKKYTHAVVHAELDPIEARKDERERCARIADIFIDENFNGYAWNECAKNIAKEIREGW